MLRRLHWHSVVQHELEMLVHCHGQWCAPAHTQLQADKLPRKMACIPLRSSFATDATHVSQKSHGNHIGHNNEC
jgi:hypothetical protein